MKEPPKFCATPKNRVIPDAGSSGLGGSPRLSFDFSLRRSHCDALLGNGRFVCYGSPRD